MLGLCDQFRCLPSQVLAEPAWVLRLLGTYALGHRDEEPGDVPEGGE